MLLALAVLGGEAVSNTYRLAGEVTVLCPLTIGGSFEVTTKTVRGNLAVDNTGALQGIVEVDLRTLRTGIALRDQHMRDTYLEVNRGPSFGVASVEDLRVDRLNGTTSFTGMMTLHGQRQTIMGGAEFERRDGRLRVRATFPIRISAFGIPSPIYLGVGVKDEIQVKVTLTAQPVE